MKTDIKKAIFFKKKDYLEIALSKNKNNADIIASYLNRNYGIVQINSGDLCDSEFISTSKRIRELCSLFDAILIIKNRLDVALIAEADGIMLDNKSIGADDCRKLTNEKFLIGFNNSNDYIKYDFTTSNNRTNDSNIVNYSLVTNNINIKTYRLDKHDAYTFNKIS